MGVAEGFSRLPVTVVPKNYNIWLRPCLETFSFRGKVDITLDVNHAVKQIELNCVEIQIASATFCQNDMSIYEAMSITYDEAKEKAFIKFDETLICGEGVLSILFNGILNDKMKGFYRNRYVVDGETKFGAATQFEASDARRCFPCWDEPALKATFDIALVVLKDMVALSNTKIIFEGEYFEDSNFKLVKYATSPLMSTYLVGIVIGEFDYVTGRTNKSVPVNVYTPKGKQNQGEFALDVAIKAIEFYEEYFKIAYPLQKLDLIALANFSIGAMENWGLVTFRETALLIDKDNSSSESLQFVSIVVCHELAHMWFGNLVTMEWWTDLWLKEGFATFMEYVATDDQHPELDAWTYFVCTPHKRAKDLDALESSHPIEVTVHNPNEVSEIFDEISYSKGATVIRMLHNWLGDEKFRKGAQTYLTRYSYGNASTENLWDALGDASGMPVREVMSTWTRQMGYPVIKVSVSSKDSEKTSLQLVQEKFLSSSNVKLSKCLWQIPVTVFTNKSTDDTIKKFLMKDEKMEVVLDDVANKDWIKLNHAYYGFYRVKYDEKLLPPLLTAVKEKQLSSHDRLNIQNDLFALASSGLSSTVDFLSALESYKAETDYAVWSDIDSNIASLTYLLWDKTDVFAKFKACVLNILEDIAEKLGWDPSPDETLSDSMLRAVVIRRLGKFGSTNIINEARKRFDDHIAGVRLLGVNLGEAVYTTVLTHPRPDDLEKIIELHDTVDLHAERVRIQCCMGCVTEPSQLSQVLNFAMSDKVRNNDKVFLIGAMARSSPAGQNAAWEFVKSEWDKFYELYNGSYFIARLIKKTTENFSTKERLDEVRSFFSTHTAQAADRSLKQSFESIEKKICWWKRDGEAMQDWIMKAS